MESVLFPIHAEPCNYIVQGIKEWEFRTRPPKIETPYKGYIYCTGGRLLYENFPHGNLSREIKLADYRYAKQSHALNGKVIGEFICDRTVEVVRHGFVNPFAINSQVLEKGHLSNSEFLSYTDHYRKDLYALHISQLVIYDKPKDITAFKRPHNRANCGVRDCGFYGSGRCAIGGNCDKLTIRKAPQSWCFAELL